MYGFLPEELAWATIVEREHEARRASLHATTQPRARPLRAAVARKLVKTGLRLDPRASVAVLKAVAKAGL